MKKNLLRQVLQYIFLLAVSLALFWFALRGIHTEEITSRLSEVNWFWIGLSLGAAFISFILRAWRWSMLMRPLGFRPSLKNTFSALMVGYLANFAIPRIGEVVRCGILRKAEGVPVSNSIGTVLAERALDFIMLLLVTGSIVLLEWGRLATFLNTTFAAGNRPDSFMMLWLALAAATLFIIGMFLWRVFHPRLLRYGFYQKVMGFGKDLLQGLLSIRRVKQQGAFWASTLLIWVMYYFMTYLIMFSLPHTSDIGYMVGFSLLAMGGIAMAAPVQGGIGTYHVLVSGLLMIYGLTEADAIFLALLMHTTQSVFAIFLGAVSLLYTFIKGTKILRHEVEPA